MSQTCTDSSIFIPIAVGIPYTFRFSGFRINLLFLIQPFLDKIPHSSLPFPLISLYQQQKYGYGAGMEMGQKKVSIPFNFLDFYAFDYCYYSLQRIQNSTLSSQSKLRSSPSSTTHP